MVEPRLQWRRREGDGGVLDGHDPELGGNSTLKREPNSELVDSSSRRLKRVLNLRSCRGRRAQAPSRRERLQSCHSQLRMK